MTSAEQQQERSEPFDPLDPTFAYGDPQSVDIQFSNQSPVRYAHFWDVDDDTAFLGYVHLDAEGKVLQILLDNVPSRGFDTVLRIGEWVAVGYPECDFANIVEKSHVTNEPAIRIMYDSDDEISGLLLKVDNYYPM